jgi:flagellar hook-length control protein FliK
MLKILGNSGEAPPAAAPGDLELFASLVAAGTPTIAPAAEAVPGEGEAIEVPTAESETMIVDAALLLPLLDQQRSAAPAPVILPAEPAKSAVAGPIAKTISPDPIRVVTQPAPDAHRAASGDSAPSKAPGIQAAAPSSETDMVLKSIAPIADQKTAALPAGTKQPKAPGAPQPGATAPTAQSIAPVSAPLPPEAARQVTTPAPKPEGTDPAATTPAREIAAAAAQPVAERKTGRAAPAKPVVAPAAPVEETAREPVTAATPQDRQATLGATMFGQQLAAIAAGPGATAPVQNVGAALAAQVLDLAKGGEWIDQLARDISRASAADGSMRFRLAPETLGELRVEITQSERGAHVRMNVSSEAAQQALAEAQPRLLAEARAQGTRIAEAQISFAGGQSEGQTRDAGRQAQNPPDQPIRAARTARVDAANESAPAPAGPARSDRYA